MNIISICIDYSADIVDYVTSKMTNPKGFRIELWFYIILMFFVQTMKPKKEIGIPTTREQTFLFQNSENPYNKSNYQLLVIYYGKQNETYLLVSYLITLHKGRGLCGYTLLASKGFVLCRILAAQIQTATKIA